MIATGFGLARRAKRATRAKRAGEAKRARGTKTVQNKALKLHITHTSTAHNTTQQNCTQHKLNTAANTN